MGLKERIQRKIEKDAVKVDVKGEEVILKKGGIPKDWKRIYPPIDENGKINWTNLIFGGRKNLIRLIMILIVVGMILMAFYELTNSPCMAICSKYPEIWDTIAKQFPRICNEPSITCTGVY